MLFMYKGIRCFLIISDRKLEKFQIRWVRLAAVLVKELYNCFSLIRKKQLWSKVTSNQRAVPNPKRQTLLWNSMMVKLSLDMKVVTCQNWGHLGCAKELGRSLMLSHLLCRNNGRHQGFFQGHWWWNMSAFLGIQILLCVMNDQSNEWALVANFLKIVWNHILQISTCITVNTDVFNHL